MTGAVLLVLGLVAPAAATPSVTPAPSARAPGRPWIVVQTDGTKVTFAAPPESREGRLVGRLDGSGTLVSIPAARVDAEATARANRAASEAAATLTPAPAPTSRPFETPPLGERFRLRTSGEEAQRVLEGARKGTRSPTPSPGATPAAGPAPGEEAPVDRYGQGEEFWRKRAGPIRDDLKAAEQFLADAEAELEAAERAYLGKSGPERTSFVVRVYEARDRAEQARAEHRRAKLEWETLEEEARKSGAFPGWLR